MVHVNRVSMAPYYEAVDCISVETFLEIVCAPLNCTVRGMMRASLVEWRGARLCPDFDDRACALISCSKNIATTLFSCLG